MKYVARALLALAALLGALAAAEGLLRLLGYGAPLPAEDLILRWKPHAPFRPSDDPALQFDLEPGFEGRQLFSHTATRAPVLSVPIRLSALGSRGAHGPTPPEEAARLLGLGDSIAFGWGVLEEESWIAVAGAALSGAQPVEAINRGVPGYDLIQVLQRFELQGRALAPDVVVYLYHANDIQSVALQVDALRHDSVALPAPDWARREGGLRHMHALNLLWRALEARQLAAQLADSSSFDLHRLRERNRAAPVLTGMRASFARFAQTCAALEARCLVALVPHMDFLPADPLPELLETAAAEARAAGLETLDLTPVLTRFPLQTLRALPGDPHPGAEAHRAMGLAVADYLKEP